MWRPIFLLLFSLGAASLVHHTASTSSRGDGTTTEILGMSKSAAIDELGVPDRIVWGWATTRFEYHDGSGDPVTVWFHTDRAFCVDPPSATLASPSPKPAEGVYLGQPLQEAIAWFGTPTSVMTSSTGMFEIGLLEGRSIAVGDGIVVAVRP